MKINELRELLNTDLETVKTTVQRSEVAVRIVRQNYERFMQAQMETLQKFIRKQENFMYGCDEENRIKYLSSMPVDSLSEIKLSTANASVKAESDLQHDKWSKDQLLNAKTGRGMKWMTDYV